MIKKPIHLYKAKDLEPCSSSMEEQETVISFSREGGTAVIWTSDNTMLTKLKKLMGGESSSIELKEISWERGRPAGYKFEVSKKQVKVMAPRVISEERKEQLRETGKKMAEARKVKGKEEK